MKKTMLLIAAFLLACLGLVAVTTPANATGNSTVKYGTTFTYNGSGNWTVTNTDNSKALKNLGNPQSVLCTNYDTGLNKPCTDGASYNTHSNETNAGQNCIYIQGDGGGHGSWDTVPGDAGKKVCSDEPTTPNPNGKDVTLCHFDNGTGTRVTVTTGVWNSTHKSHASDVWAAFTYTTIGGSTVNVPEQGNQALLNFADCKIPQQDIKVVPSYTKIDKCGTKNDSVSLVPGTGYSGGVVLSGTVDYTVTAATDAGYVFDAIQMAGWTLSNSNTHATATVKLTDEDCDLPDTGSSAQYNYTAGGLALLVMAGIGGIVLMTRKRITV